MNVTDSKKRKIKVYSQSQNNKVNVPTIILKGEWLKKYGFNCNDSLELICENSSILIKNTQNN